MPKARLYVPSRLEGNAPVDLEGDRAHYLGRVLRLKPGAELTVFDGSGSEFPAVVSRMRKDHARLDVGAANAHDAESPLCVRLVQGVARSERMDFVVQKATELGVAEIQAVLTARSVVRLNAERAARRAAHWQRVAISACEQSGRNRVPHVGRPVELAGFFAKATDAAMRITLAPGSAEKLSAAEPPGSGRIELLVGPEGGLSEAEIEAAAAVGFRPYSMGPRILRAETAGMTALAILQSRWGDI